MRSRDYAPLLFRMTSRVLYRAQYHRQHCTLQAFEQIGVIYMHSHDDKNPARPGFEPGYKPQSIQISHRGRPTCYRVLGKEDVLFYRPCKEKYLFMSLYCTLKIREGLLS